MPSKLTPEEFISRSKKLHGESKYDYSECVYVRAKDKVQLRCVEHDHWFNVTPNTHISKGVGCPKCTGNYSPTTEEFIEQSKALHGELKYDYSRCAYAGARVKVELRCIGHDHWFLVTPNAHISHGHGCAKCAGNYPHSNEEFTSKSKAVHGVGKYDYSECRYVGSTTKVKLRCVEHDHWFNAHPSSHLNRGVGCPKCAGNYIPTTEEFIARSKSAHGESKYDYSECTYNGRSSKVKLRCIEHDHWFYVSPSNHIHNSAGCTRCTGHYIPTTEEFITRSKEVHGESKYDYGECRYVSAHKKISLRCVEHNHWFNVTPGLHIQQKIGCPVCNPARFSKKQLQYFNHIECDTGIVIQHAGNMGEYKIDGVGQVDGYCIETNTIYEFHGTFWHGYPSKYIQDDIHPINKKSYGELYTTTIARDQKIRDLGYHLIIMWEHEWDKIEKELNCAAK